MDVVGSEIGHKMRSAIKAKLTELGCYVDDELPDYVMVMVANKRTRAQMEDDLQLFLGDNTELFVNWLHQVLKKLQEVTVTTPLKTAEPEKVKEKSKEKKSKVKKEKGKLKKIEGIKKSKKKDKDKSHKKKDKEEKKAHKSKKKSKHHGIIRPNIPPLLMNIEKDSEPSITDIFAGQILKNHGVTMDMPKEEKHVDEKPVIEELKRPILLPIIDPATISATAEPDMEASGTHLSESQEPVIVEPSESAPTEERINEITEIEAKIHGLKQKLAEQLDSMSDDEDFLNIRTEAEELMNDFAEDVFQEISSQAPVVVTPPPSSQKPQTPPIHIDTPDPPKELPKVPETLPQIELNLPKRPVRERLGTREERKKIPEVKQKQSDKRTKSPERYTPEKEPEFWPKSKSAKSRLGDPVPEVHKRISASDDSDKSDASAKKVPSKVSALERRPRVTCASVVRVRPRPRVAAPASSLLMRAVADAHRSLLNIPPKVDPEPPKVKRAMVLPMRRTVDAQKILISVPCDRARKNTDITVDSDGGDKSPKAANDIDKEEYVPSSITKVFHNSDYVPSRRPAERTSSRRDDTLVIETINIHNTTVDKDKRTQFIVTMDGFNPNAFLAKKLETEGLLDNDEVEKPTGTKTVLKIGKTTELGTGTVESKKETAENTEDTTSITTKNAETTVSETTEILEENVSVSPKQLDDTEEIKAIPKKRLSNTSDESDTQVIIKPELSKVEKRKSSEPNKASDLETSKVESPPVKKRKASPIVFNINKNEREIERVKQKERIKEKERDRTDSVNSESHVTVTTVLNTHKYDSLPPLSVAERKLAWCRSFPACRYGAACVFLHPRCKFAAACTRRDCVYSHGARAAGGAPLAPAVASHVVPAASFKSITPGALPAPCKYYPNCTNPACHFYHPKPCRYGKACGNKLECNFYHSDALKWRPPV